jgi:predicted nucleic acid-binding protein
MNAVDTNILVYRLDRSDPVKQRKARALLQRLASGGDPAVMP